MNFISNRETIVRNHNDKSVNIAFCADENYVKYMGVGVFSILDNNRDLKINFHIFVTAINIEDIEKLKSISSIYNNFNLDIYYINTVFFDELPICEHFSTAIYYRLIIPYVLSDRESVLYVDTDIICLGDISSIFNEISEKTVSAVEDLISKDYLSKLGKIGFEINPYFNSGVLLINNKKWIELEVFEKVLYLVKNNNFKYPDQDALNILFQNDKNILPRTFNFMEWEKTYRDKDLYNNMVFLHFIGATKPWCWIGIHPKYDFYLKKSPWKDIQYILPKTTSDFRRASNRFWRIGQKKKAIKYKCIYLIRKLLRKK
ncbi:hypothetical protein GVX76_02940 [[Haemophilus] felis]|nr:hypothetical protein [[Haemophilus] felis]